MILHLSASYYLLTTGPSDTKVTYKSYYLSIIFQNLVGFQFKMCLSLLLPAEDASTPNTRSQSKKPLNEMKVGGVVKFDGGITIKREEDNYTCS